MPLSLPFSFSKLNCKLRRTEKQEITENASTKQGNAQNPQTFHLKKKKKKKKGKMAAFPICSCNSSPHLLRKNPLSFIYFPSSLSPLPLGKLHFRGLRARSDGGGSRSGEAGDPALLRKPSISVEKAEISDEEEREERGFTEKEDEWVDWEDQILEDTVPLAGFVRMVLHSGKYVSGDRLSAEHEKTITERLLPYHPEFEKKIGCGIDYITIGYHPDFESSRCLFIVRKDGETVDFSYWKCIKGLIRKKYPLYADTFILRHFRRRGRGD